MPISSLDPQTALIVIDLQQNLLQSGNDTVAAIVRQAVSLTKAFRERGLPVVLVQVVGTPAGRSDVNPPGGARTEGWTELIPELVEPGDIHITKRAWGAFSGTDLDARLRALQMTQVVLCGVATSLGVESTARQAFDLGYNVVLATDAMMDRTPEAHQEAIAERYPMLGQTATVQDVLGALAN